jgi:hypothetical protein
MGQLLEIIQTPGLTAVEIHRALAKRSWAARRFGKWAAMFGPTYGSMYVALAWVVVLCATPLWPRHGLH